MPGYFNDGYGGLTASDAGQNSFQGYLGTPKPQMQMQQPMGMGGMAQPPAAGGGYLDGAMGGGEGQFEDWIMQLKKKMEGVMGPYHPLEYSFGGSGTKRADHGIEFSDYSPFVSAPSKGYR